MFCCVILLVKDYHAWLLGEDVDILPRLLLPLAGPEEFDDDEMEKLPLDLQYLPPEKKREPDGDMRTMLIESIMQVHPQTPNSGLVWNPPRTILICQCVSCNKEKNYSGDHLVRVMDVMSCGFNLFKMLGSGPCLL